MVIETTSPAWKASILTIVLHVHMNGNGAIRTLARVQPACRISSAIPSTTWVRFHILHLAVSQIPFNFQVLLSLTIRLRTGTKYVVLFFMYYFLLFSKFPNITVSCFLSTMTTFSYFRNYCSFVTTVFTRTCDNSSRISCRIVYFN